MVTLEEQQLVLARLRSLPPTFQIGIAGLEGQIVLNRDQMIREVELLTDAGQQIIKQELQLIRFFAKR